MFLVAVLVLGLIAMNGVYSSKQWTRFRNAHGCEIVPRVGAVPRSYVCNGTACAGPTDCRSINTKETAP